MTLLSSFFARRLAKLPRRPRPTARDRIMEKTRQLQRELGWPEGGRLA